VEDGIDVAIRIGEVADSGLHAKRIGAARRICVAAPRYLEAHGTPDSPAELRVHNCVLYTLLATGATWPFEGMPVKVFGRVRGNSPEVVMSMALNGLGIAMAPAFLFTEAVASGQLREILNTWRCPGYRSTHFTSPGATCPDASDCLSITWHTRSPRIRS